MGEVLAVVAGGVPPAAVRIQSAWFAPIKREVPVGLVQSP